MKKEELLFVTGCFPKEKQQYYLKNSNNCYSLASDVLSWRIIEGLDLRYSNKFYIYSCPFVPTFPFDYKKPILKSYKWSHVEGSDKKDKVIGCLNVKYLAIFDKSRKLKNEIIKWIKGNTLHKYILFYSNDISFMKIVQYIKIKYPEIKIYVLITDLNEFDNDPIPAKNVRELIKQKKFNYRINTVYKNMEYVDGFILLAESMKEYINIAERPYIICEGICNAKIPYTPLVDKKGIFRIVYTGNLHERYGILKVAEAVGQLGKEFELVICGDGDSKEKLISLTKKYSNIKFNGMLPNKEVIELQQTADLLVNSMPNFGRHTELSFPSKLMEYMVQARPVVCFKVSGIPDEYDEYLMYFDKNSIESIKNKIKEIAEMPFEDRKKIAEKNRNFILSKKNQIVQTQRIIDFITR